MAEWDVFPGYRSRDQCKSNAYRGRDVGLRLSVESGTADAASGWTGALVPES